MEPPGGDRVARLLADIKDHHDRYVDSVRDALRGSGLTPLLVKTYAPSALTWVEGHPEEFLSQTSLPLVGCPGCLLPFLVRITAVRVDLAAHEKQYLSEMCRSVHSFGADDAEDIAEEAFTWLWYHPQKYDEAKGKIVTFLKVAARSIAKSKARKRRDGVASREEQQEETPNQDWYGIPEAPFDGPNGDAQRIAIAVVMDTSVWRKECLPRNHRPGRGEDNRGTAWDRLDHDPTDSSPADQTDDCQSSGAARAEAFRLRKELRATSELLGFRTQARGSPRPRGELILERLDQHGQWKCRVYFAPTSDLQHVGDLLGASVRLVAVSATDPSPGFRSPLRAVPRDGSCLIEDGRGQIVGRVHLELRENGSILGWIVCPAPIERRRR